MSFIPLPAAPEPAAPAASLRRDLLSAYGAAFARIASWVIISGLLIRHSTDEFAMFALVRATIGLLTYTSLGLSPAIIHLLPRLRRPGPRGIPGPVPVRPVHRSARQPVIPAPLYASAAAVALLCGTAAIALAVFYARRFNVWHRVPRGLIADMPDVVLLMGIGVALRLVGDAAGAMLQSSGRIATDYLILIIGECAWVGLSAITPEFGVVAFTFALIAAVVCAARWGAASAHAVRRWPQASQLSLPVMRALLSMGLLVAIAQAADFFYAPTDYILINRLLAPADVAVYAPAVQIDAGLLLLVSGLAAVLLPRAAIAHADADRRTLYRYYLRGTLASAAILIVAGAAAWAAAPLLFRIWLGSKMPGTRAILPLVLIHTVAGGSSAVGRSILLGMGKVKPFTLAVLAAGALNVACSYAAVRYFHLGLRGIVLGTLIAVILRCLVWMPWYVLRTLAATPALSSRSEETGT